MTAPASAPTPPSSVDAALSCIEDKLGRAKASGRPFSVLVVKGPIEALDDEAEVFDLGHETVVALPGIHLERACALAERWVRHHPEARIGVASALPQLSDARHLIDRARVALRTAQSGPVGPVVSMSWVDVSTDLPHSSL